MTNGSSSPTADGFRVLVVDDNDVNRMLIAAMLKTMGCTVDIVETGRKAVAAAGSAAYDIIFMDVGMPDMDGMDATKAIRAQGGRNATLPIVAVTAHAMVGDRERFLASGMSDYISKPYRKADLQAAIDKARAAAKS